MTTRSRIGHRLRRALDRRPRAAGAVVLAVAALLAVLSTVAVGGLPFGGGRTLRVALPGRAPLLRAGADVRVAGQRVGEVRAVEVRGRGAVARLDLDDDRTVGAGARARVRMRGMAGAVYVELEPGDSRRPLPDGALVPGDRTSAAVDLTHVLAGFDRDARAALARSLRTAGFGLAGRGGDVNAALADAPAALDEATPLVRALRPPPGLLDAADRVARALGPGDAGTTPDLGALVASADRVAGAAADGARALGRSLDAAPPLEAVAARALPEADAVLDEAEPALRALRPGVAALARALPDAIAVERRAPRLDDAGAVARAAQPVLRGAPPMLVAARRPAAALGPLSGPLGDLSKTLVPYRRELVEAPAGFTRWGEFRYDAGQARGHRAVRFTMVFTCARARDAYPAPGAAEREREACR